MESRSKIRLFMVHSKGKKGRSSYSSKDQKIVTLSNMMSLEVDYTKDHKSVNAIILTCDHARVHLDSTDP